MGLCFAFGLAGCAGGDQGGLERAAFEFRERLGWFESRGDYTIVNRYGYLGKYQMGECALIDTGFYFEDDTGCLRQDWIGPWSGAHGVDSVAAYLSSPEAQDRAVQGLINQNWREMRRRGLDIYVGQRVAGVHVTIAGMLAGAHLGGVGGVERFLGSRGASDPSDAFGTSISSYMERFADADPPVDPRGQIFVAAAEEIAKTGSFSTSDWN